VSVSETTSGYGKSLTDSTIWSIVSYTINKGLLPADANGVYFVLTAPGMMIIIFIITVVVIIIITRHVQPLRLCCSVSQHAQLLA
jgi:hypothetical protein